MEPSQSQEPEAPKEVIEKLLTDARMHIPYITYRCRYDAYKLIATAKQLADDLQSKHFNNISNLIKVIDAPVNEDASTGFNKKQKQFNAHKKAVLDEIAHLLSLLEHSPSEK